MAHRSGGPQPAAQESAVDDGDSAAESGADFLFLREFVCRRQFKQGVKHVKSDEVTVLRAFFLFLSIAAPEIAVQLFSNGDTPKWNAPVTPDVLMEWQDFLSQHPQCPPTHRWHLQKCKFVKRASVVKKNKHKRKAQGQNGGSNKRHQAHSGLPERDASKVALEKLDAEVQNKERSEQQSSSDCSSVSSVRYD